jgi:hypothetical protein
MAKSIMLKSSNTRDDKSQICLFPQSTSISMTSTRYYYIQDGESTLLLL